MLKPEDNVRITRVGAGTPMGRLMRRYWQPIALSSELPEPEGAPLRVRLLGEDLIAYRESDGAIGLVDAFCPHRRAPMFFGRNEEHGLRCVYHGWKFDRAGACVDMPSEPPDSLFKSKVRIAAYPTHEAGGFVWAYLGAPEEQPGPPDFEVCRAPATHRFASKTYEACNWLQALEGGIDSAHSTFLHNMNLRETSLLRRHAPEIEFEKMPYGLAGAAVHDLDRDTTYARTFHYVLPAQSIRANIHDRTGGKNPTPYIHGHMWVPIDDEQCYVYNYLLSHTPAIPIARDFALAQEKAYGRGPDDLLPGFRLKANRENDYLIDRAAQRTRTYSGIAGINTQDYALQEGMGPILDRSREHLAHSDRVIILARQLLLEAMQANERGDVPRGVDPATYRTVRAADDIIPKREHWARALEPELRAVF
jgi:phenylpropionate dioxygenase-like ring-hydroxylating dioxygenase large terminal subunit